MWFSDLRTEARFAPPGLFAELGVLSGTDVAVRGHMGEVLGVLGGYSRAARAFSADDSDALQILAGVVSSGVSGRRSEGRFRALVKNSSELMAVADRSGALVYANPAAQAMFGFSPAGTTGRCLLGLVHPADRSKAVEAFRCDHIPTGRPPGHPFPGSGRLRESGGSSRWSRPIAWTTPRSPVSC